MARETHGATWRELKSEVAPIMRGATASFRGAPGMCGAPAAGQQGMFWRGDATWAVPDGGGGGGAVDSVTGSGGSTGLTMTGGPTGDVELELGGVLNIASGGHGASTVGGAQVALELEPGVDVQEYSANLAYLAGVTLAANIKSILNAADYAAVRTLLGLVVGTNVIGEPLGHDISVLSNVVSHWRCLEADLGTTTMTDVNAAHHGTVAATWQASGRPWYSSEGQQWCIQKVTLANTANLLTELLTTCGWMGWVWVPEIPVGAVAYFQFDASGETSATNVIFSVGITATNDLFVSWEHSSGTNVNTTMGKVAPGLHHIYVGRLHSGTSSIYAMIDGISQTTVTGLTNPSGGGSSVGYFLHSASAAGFVNPGAGISDCVLFSGGLPSAAEVLTQYKRGMGIY